MFENKVTSKDFNWRSVEYVQSCVKDAVGIGKSYILNFFAPINEESDSKAAEEIDYNYKQMPDDLKLLQEENYEEYMRKQLLKVCHYL